MKTTTFLLRILPAALLFAFAIPHLPAAEPSKPSAAEKKGAVKPYPRDVCIVTGNKLGSMGSPITKVHGDQQVKFCCKPCVSKFAKNPQRFLAGL